MQTFGDLSMSWHVGLSCVFQMCICFIISKRCQKNPNRIWMLLQVLNFCGTLLSFLHYMLVYTITNHIFPASFWLSSYWPFQEPPTADDNCESVQLPPRSGLAAEAWMEAITSHSNHPPDNPPTLWICTQFCAFMQCNENVEWETTKNLFIVPTFFVQMKII